MSSIPRWFDRTFDTPYPAELLPVVLTRLRGSPARLEELVQRWTRATLAAKPEGAWSAQEHSGHLLDLEPLWLARVNDFAAARTSLTSADLTSAATESANHNARPIGQILSGFRAARALLIARVDGLERSRPTHTIPHPRLRTPMTLVDHLHFVAEHDDHHLARIWELVAGA